MRAFVKRCVILFHFSLIVLLTSGCSNIENLSPEEGVTLDDGNDPVHRTKYEIIYTCRGCMLEHPLLPGFFMDWELLGQYVNYNVNFYHIVPGPPDPIALEHLYHIPGVPFYFVFFSSHDNPYWTTFVANVSQIPPGWLWETESHWDDCVLNLPYIGDIVYPIELPPFRFYLAD